jgi:hypothetical protein
MGAGRPRSPSDPPWPALNALWSRSSATADTSWASVRRPRSAPNFTIVVLDNGHLGETGMQDSHTSLGTVAEGFWISNTMRVTDVAQAEEIAAHPGPRAHHRHHRRPAAGAEDPVEPAATPPRGRRPHP